MKNKIEIKVQTSERMTAITNLAIAIRNVAESLRNPTKVYIENCTIQSDKNNPGINIDKLDEDFDQSIIKEIDE